MWSLIDSSLSFSEEGRIFNLLCLPRKYEEEGEGSHFSSFSSEVGIQNGYLFLSVYSFKPCLAREATRTRGTEKRIVQQRIIIKKYDGRGKVTKILLFPSLFSNLRDDASRNREVNRF
jgi:hypothetical protein